MTLVVSSKPADLDQPAEAAVEGEIREFVRRDGPSLRRSPEMDSELVANNISTLLQRVAGSSVQEIDRLITEYAHLSQSAMQSTKIIAESLGKWKGGADWAPRTAQR